MPEKTNETSSLSPLEKGAIILALTEPQLAAEVVAELTPNQLRNLLSAFQKVQNLNKEVINTVIEEFIDTYNNLKDLPPLELESFIKKILNHVPENIREVLESLLTQPELKIKLQQLETLNARHLANLLKKEHPQIIAVILALLSPQKVAKVIKELPEELKIEVIKRMASLESIPAERVKLIIENFLREIKEFVGEEIKVDGVKQAASVLASMDKRTTEEILNMIEKEDPELAEKIREKMFVFEDIIRLDDKAILELLKTVDKFTLALALKGAPNEVLEKILRNMSKRAANTLMETIETLGKVKKSEVLKARRQIVKIIRRLIEQGIIPPPEVELENQNED